MGRANKVVSGVFCLLLISQLVGIAVGAGVVSEFSTDADFNNATTLDDMFVASNTVEYDNRTYGQSAPLLPEPTSSQSANLYKGVVIDTNQQINGLTVVLTKNSTPGEVRLENTTSTIETVPVNGDKVTFSSTLDAGTAYYVVAGDNGSSYTQTQVGASYPYVGTSLDVVNGRSSSGNFSNLWNIRAVYPSGDTLASFSQNDSQYVSANHTVSNPSEVAVDMTLENTSATVAVEKWTGSTWQISQQSTFSTTGNHSVQIADTGDTWRTNISVSASDVQSQAVIKSETYLYDGNSPTISDVQPLDNQYVNTSTTLSAQINDSDFPTQQSDSVSVDFVVNGSVVGSDTLTSNGTASTPWTPSTTGVLSYQVQATDEYGNQRVSQTQTINVPDQLEIRNETNTSELIDTPVEVTVRVYGESKIYERTTTDGTIDLAGLPANQPLIIEVSANQDYYARTIRIESILQQQTAYLLSKNETSVESRFNIDDPTGEFSTETVLRIEKPINESGTVEYRTIVADQFGAEGVTTTLQEGRRYRVTVKAPDGTTQVIGPYRADVSETVTISPGAPAIDVDDYQDGWGTNADLTNQTLDVAYSDPAQETTALTIFVHEKGNTSNQLAPNESYVNLGNVTTQYSLTANESKKTWDVEYIITRNGETFTKTETVQNRPGLTFPSLDEEWRLIGGLGMLLFFAGSFSVLNRAVGGIAVGVVGGVLWWAGWLSGATTGAAIALYLLIAIVYSIYTSGGP